MVKVSVIIPVYNVEKYLEECLDSVINQTLKDIEIICVDDGSTDTSFKILQQYKKNDNRIKVFHQKNKGAGAARNNGIRHAEGKYLAILDADDIYDVSMLEKMYCKSEELNLDINICRCRHLNNQTMGLEAMNWTLRTDYLPCKIFNKDDIPEHIFGFCIGWSWDKLINRKFVTKNRLKFQNLRSTNDMLFVFMSLVLADRISYIDEVLCTHRYNTKTQLSETRDKDFFCFIKAIYELQRQLKKHNLYNKLEQSFVNWNTEFCFWHLNTISNLNALVLKQILIDKVFPKIDAYSKEKDYYYNINTYNRIQEFKAAFKVHKKEQLQNVFSVRNSDDKSHKVVTVSGIKFKFRNKNKKTEYTS